ncbi:hypothetical protein A2U01_0101903, partial [Trifolium medium]|nr:hypothetical protein [Trifolium medium]
SLNGEIQKTAHVIQRDCHLPARRMEAAGLPVSSLNKGSKHTGINENISRSVQPMHSCGLYGWFPPLQLININS